MVLRRSMAFSHVIYAAAFPALAAALALVAVVILVLRFVEAPQTLKVAVGPPGGTDAALMGAIARRLRHNRDGVRLAVVAVDGPAEAARALESGAADLAVVRSDGAVPANGLTAAVLHNDVAVLAAPHGSALKQPSQLAGKRVGIFPPTAANAALLDAVLAEYEVAPTAVHHLPLADGDLAHAAAERQIDALFAVGPLHGAEIETAIEKLTSGRRDPVLIAIDAADGMAARGEAYQKVDLPNGFFPGAPPLPNDDFATLGVAVRLEARATLSETTVGDLVKRVFDMRRLIAAEAPVAAAIEKSEGDKGSTSTIHPGAEAYYTDNEKSFMDIYGDWIYIGAMMLSGVGSGLAAMLGLMRARARKEALALIDRLIELKQEAHRSMSLPRLAELETEIEALSTSGLRFAREHNFDEAGLSALRLAIDEARRAICDQCNELQEKSALIANAAAMRTLPKPAPSAGSS